MGIKRFFKELFQSQRERDVNELLNELHDSGVIKLNGRKDPTFGPSVLEIEEETDRDNYCRISELLGRAIVENDFSEIEKNIDEHVNLTIYKQKVIAGKQNVIQYWKDWIARHNEPCNGTKYRVRFCLYFERSALEIKPFRVKRMLLVARLKEGKVIDLLYAPNPLQNPFIRYWDFDTKALSLKGDVNIVHHLGEELEPQPNRIPCMRCGLKSEKLQWYNYHYDAGPLAYDGELSICPNCIETVEYFPTRLYSNC